LQLNIWQERGYLLKTDAQYSKFFSKIQLSKKICC
jgi:hypothetical protein